LLDLNLDLGGTILGDYWMGSGAGPSEFIPIEEKI
jgi:hypothetical protein